MKIIRLDHIISKVLFKSISKINNRNVTRRYLKEFGQNIKVFTINNIIK